MSLNITDFRFEGPYLTTNQLANVPGVYALVCRQGQSLTLIDVGESTDVKSRIAGHDRKSCWQGKCQTGQIEVAVLYTPKLTSEQRRSIEQSIRSSFNNLCGDR